METPLWVKQEILRLYDDGKDLDLRLAYPRYLRIRRGDVVILSRANPITRRRVIDIRKYPTIAEVLEREEPNRILPGHFSDKKRMITEKWRRMSPVKIEEELGILVFELQSFPRP